jgi:hypothetical protein
MLALPLLSLRVQRKKQRNTLTNRMAPPDLSGYTLLTQSLSGYVALVFMPRWRALISFCAIIIIDALLAAVKT